MEKKQIANECRAWANNILQVGTKGTVLSRALFALCPSENLHGEAVIVSKEDGKILFAVQAGMYVIIGSLANQYQPQKVVAVSNHEVTLQGGEVINKESIFQPHHTWIDGFLLIADHYENGEN